MADHGHAEYATAEGNDLPAHEAPLVYHERWEEELALDEIKTPPPRLAKSRMRA